MKAVIYTRCGPQEIVKLKEVAKPFAKANEVLVKAGTVNLTDAGFRGARYFISSILIVLMSLQSTGQPPVPVNKNDKYGKKSGFWKVFLTDRTVPTKDSVKASYFAYNLYFFGGDMSFITACKREKKRATKIGVIGAKGTMSMPKAIDGDFTFYNKKGRLILHQTFKDGFPVLFEGFWYNRRGVVTSSQIINFSENYDEQLGSYKYRKYVRQNKLISLKYFKKKGEFWIFEDGKVNEE